MQNYVVCTHFKSHSHKRARTLQRGLSFRQFKLFCLQTTYSWLWSDCWTRQLHDQAFTICTLSYIHTLKMLAKESHWCLACVVFSPGPTTYSSLNDTIYVTNFLEQTSLNLQSYNPIVTSQKLRWGWSLDRVGKTGCLGPWSSHSVL